MHLLTPESINSGKSAPRVLAKVSFDRPDTDYDRRSVKDEDLSLPHFGGVGTYAGDSDHLAATEGIDQDLHATACSSEYFLG